jgi:hypothetical protein
MKTCTIELYPVYGTRYDAIRTLYRGEVINEILGVGNEKLDYFVSKAKEQGFTHYKLVNSTDRRLTQWDGRSRPIR